jgi:hypothetical protein
MFLAVSLEVSSRARKVWKRKGIHVSQREGREPTAARTIAQVITRNRRSVGCEDRPLRSGDTASAR